MSDDERQPVASANPQPESTSPEPPFAWQPLTPGGVATIARESLGRLLLIELVVALLAVGATLGLIASDYFPIIDRAVRQLPTTGRIEHRQLIAPMVSPKTLAENSFLAFVVDPSGSGRISAAADIRVYFHRQNFEVCSLLGCAWFKYPVRWTIEFNRNEVEPRWGAWRPFLLAGTGLLVFIGLFLNWAVVAGLYCPVVYLISFYADRDLGWAGSWRLASAALMPGALLLTMGILLYGSGVIHLVQLAALAGIHLVLGWVYVAVSPFYLKKPIVIITHSTNPFTAVVNRPRLNPANPFAPIVEENGAVPDRSAREEDDSQ